MTKCVFTENSSFISVKLYFYYYISLKKYKAFKLACLTSYNKYSLVIYVTTRQLTICKTLSTKYIFNGYFNLYLSFYPK